MNLSKRNLSAGLPFIAAALALLLLPRIFYGADVTDTSFWTAEPYLLTRGAVPFADNWSQTPLSSLLIAPFVHLFTRITGGTEGIMLYMFWAAFLFRGAVSVLLWRVLRGRLGPNWAAAYGLLFFLYDYGANRYLNYNFMSQALLALGGALLWDAMGREEPRAAAAQYAWAGAVMALCALAHITQLANCLLFAVWLLILERRRYRGLPCWLPYVLSGLGVAAAVILWLEWRGGGGVFSGLWLDLTHNNYFHIPHLPLSQQLRRIAGDCAALVRLMAAPFAGILSVCLAVSLCRGKKAGFPGLTAALAGSCAYVCLFYARPYLRAFLNAVSPFTSVQPPLLCLFLAAPLWYALPPRQARRQFLPGLLFLWASGLVTFILSALFSHATANYRYSFLIQGAIFSLPLLFQALKARAPGRLYPVLPVILAAAFAAYSLSIQYASVYRDEPIPLLTCRVEEGVYQGLYTTPERAAALQRLEKEIRARTSPEEAVLFADLMPTAYLMTDARPCTPTTWDPCHYRYGFQDGALYQAYFERTGRIPDKIFFILSEENPLSIDDPENAFAAWVREHYTLAETVGEGRFSFRLFTKNR